MTAGICVNLKKLMSWEIQLEFKKRVGQERCVPITSTFNKQVTPDDWWIYKRVEHKQKQSIRCVMQPENMVALHYVRIYQNLEKCCTYVPS